MPKSHTYIQINRKPTEKVVSARNKEPIPKPSQIFEGYSNRKKCKKKDYKKKGCGCGCGKK
tara:strand:- start:199 stop:381 length:183 start_codon:yes stop_codon:yes gene_type:complete